MIETSRTKLPLEPPMACEPKPGRTGECLKRLESHRRRLAEVAGKEMSAPPFTSTPGWTLGRRWSHRQFGVVARDPAGEIANHKGKFPGGPLQPRPGPALALPVRPEVLQGINPDLDLPFPSVLPKHSSKQSSPTCRQMARKSVSKERVRGRNRTLSPGLEKKARPRMTVGIRDRYSEFGIEPMTERSPRFERAYSKGLVCVNSMGWLLETFWNAHAS